MSYKRFINNVSYALLCIFVVLFALKYFHYIKNDEFRAIVAADLIMTCHFLLGMYFNRKGLRRSQEIFMIFVFGGMVGRLFLAAGLIIFCLQVLNFNYNYLIFPVFIFYVFFLVLEIWYLIKNEATFLKN